MKKQDCCNNCEYGVLDLASDDVLIECLRRRPNKSVHIKKHICKEWVTCELPEWENSNDRNDL